MGVGSSERSQFPLGVINPYTGYVDILLYPNGSVVPTTIYSTPSSFGMSGAFFHFWLAERSDVVAMQFDNGVPVQLVQTSRFICRWATSSSSLSWRARLTRGRSSRGSTGL